MSRIFVSYAREDRPAIATLIKGLRDAGHAVWWDDRLGAGDEFRKTIEQELEAADVVLVVWSQRSRGSNWVLGEAERGVQRGVLLPVRIDDARLPLGFGVYNVLDFSAWDGNFDAKHWPTLLSEIERLALAPQPAGPRPVIKVVRHALVLALGGGVTIGTLLWVMWTLGSRSGTNGSLLGHPLVDSVLFGCIGCAPIAAWSALEAQRAGFGRRVVIARRMARWFAIGSSIGLVVIVLAVSGGAVAAKSPRDRVIEVATVFVTTSMAAAFVLTTVNLLRFATRRALGADAR